MQPFDQYLLLMRTIRSRFDLVEDLRARPGHPFLAAESAALHGRKILEALAFACMVAVENGIAAVPSDAEGQWNADAIFRTLEKKGLLALPRPSAFWVATAEEKKKNGASVLIDPMHDRRLSLDDVLEIYRELHRWLHEVNPYVHGTQDEFHTKHSGRVWSDLSKLKLYLESHFIEVHRAAFMCVLWDPNDNLTKIMGLARIELTEQHGPAN